MTKSNKAIALVVFVALVAYAMMNTPRWYEFKDGVVYGCTGISSSDNTGICMNIDSPTDSYESIYKPDFVGGEYYDFKASGMRSCVVLRKGNVYDIETLCGMNVYDTAEFFKAGVLR